MLKLFFLVILVILVIGSCARAPMIRMTLTEETMNYYREGKLTSFDSTQVAENAKVLREERKAKIFGDTLTARARAEAIKVGTDYSGNYFGRILNKSDKKIIVTHSQSSKIYTLDPYQISPEIGLSPQSTKFWAKFYDPTNGKYLGDYEICLEQYKITTRKDNIFEEMVYDWIVWFEWKN